METIEIDLGELGRSAAPPSVSTSPVARLRRARVAGVALAVCAVIAGVAAAAPPPGPEAELIFTVPWVNAVALDREALYLVTGDTEVTAYRLVDGTERWRADLPRPVAFLASTGGPIAISGDDRCRETEYATAMDAATGRVLWSRAGTFAWASRSALLLWRPDEQCAPSGMTAPRGGTVDVIEHATGAVRHSIPVRSGWDIGPTGDTMLTWDATGELAEFDIATGARHDRGRLPALARRPKGRDEPPISVTAIGDAWVVLSPLTLDSAPGRQSVAVNAYALADGAPLWEQTLPEMVWRDGVFFTDCEHAVCVVSYGRQTVLIDPLTGTPTGSIPGAYRTLPGTGWAVSMSSDAGLGVPANPLVDARTGLPDPTGWYQLPAVTGSSGAVLARRLADRLDFAVLDTQTGKLRPLGSLGGEMYTGCDATDGYVMCATDGLVSVWHLR